MSDVHPGSEPRARDRAEAWLLVVLAVVALAGCLLRGPVLLGDVVGPAPTAWWITPVVLLGLLLLAVESVRAGRLADARMRAVRLPVAIALLAEIVLAVLPWLAAPAVVVGVVALAVAAARLLPLEPARSVRQRIALHGPVLLALGWTAALTPAAGESLGATLGLGGGEASVLLAWAAVIVVGIAGTWVIDRTRAPLPFAIGLLWGLAWTLPGGPEWMVTPVLVAILAVGWVLVRRLTRTGPPTWSGAFA
ncbi:hypothetical protein [Actinomycetospora sp. CA-084318]|uniref:hypothetical protein n=1 Tax=Actinomycetospora sp. CA-084318 TaxID=3239892 RepID=UPI003D959DDA